MQKKNFTTRTHTKNALRFATKKRKKKSDDDDDETVRERVNIFVLSLFFSPTITKRQREEAASQNTRVQLSPCVYFCPSLAISLQVFISLSLSLSLKKRCLYDVIIVNVKRRLSSARSPFDPSSNNERCVFHRSSQHSPSGAPRAIQHANDVKFKSSCHRLTHPPEQS